MKTRFAMLILLAVVAGCSSSSHYSSLTREETAERVSADIAARDMVIKVDRAMPLRGRSINLTGGYTLRISGDSVYSHLPYYGRAYSIPYGGGEGLIFSSTINDYRQSAGSKGESRIYFTTRTREDRYEFNVTVWSNGSADISVNPGNRQGINFSGLMDLDAKK